MKKAIALIIILITLFFSVQYISTKIKKNHEVEYEIKKDDITFVVKEKYSKKLDNSYSIQISDKTNNFVYTIDNKFNKQKKIIKDVIYETNGNTLCIYPILLNNQKSYIECSSEGKIYSYYSFKNNDVMNKLVLKLNELHVDLSSLNENNNETLTTDTSILYNKNILNNDVFVVWDYKGVDLINYKTTKYMSLYNYDKYENTHGSVVGNYYVTPQYNYGTVFDFNKLNIINLDELSKKTINLDQTVRQDTYINGVVDNKLYYFDPDSMNQIEINPKNKSQKIVGNEKNNAKFYSNGNWSNINIYEFKTNKKIFTNDYSNETKLLSYNPVQIFESKNNYYYLTSDNNFYQLNKNFMDNPILLFNQSNMKEIKVVYDTIYHISGDTLYFYNNDNGLKMVLKNNEWNYNYSNIYGIYKKSK